MTPVASRMLEISDAAEPWGMLTEIISNDDWLAELFISLPSIKSAEDDTKF